MSEIVQTVVLKPCDDGPKGRYSPNVELLLMDDGTVQWRYDDDE